VALRESGRLVSQSRLPTQSLIWATPKLFLALFVAYLTHMLL
jgi:hypothetical protein